jgi:hypothetical protein
MNARRELACLKSAMAEPFDWAAWSADFDAKMATFKETIARHRAELEALAMVKRDPAALEAFRGVGK